MKATNKIDATNKAETTGDIDGTAEWSSVDQLSSVTKFETEPVVRPGRVVPLLVGVIGSAAVFGVGITLFRQRVETDLTSRTRDALVAAGVPSAEVSFIGRDATVRVPTGTDTNRVKSVVLGATGPRAVVVLIDKSAAPQPVPSTAAPLPSEDVSAQIQADGSIVLDGKVSSIDAKLALVGGVKAQSPTVIVVDNTTVAPTGMDAKTSTWVGKSIGEFRRVGSTNAGVRGTADGLVLTGSVPTLAIRDAANAFIAESGLGIVGSLQINNPSDLNVVVPDSGIVVPEDGVPIDGEGTEPETGLFAEPTPDAQNAQAKLNSLIAASTIEFKPSSADLTGAGRTVVESVFAILNDNPELRITVIGHTDTNGDPISNVALSVARAEAVRAALVQLGAQADRITTEGVGGSQPLVPNDTPAQRKQNRRIEIQVAVN
jgi:outer membrane protein OmpA-like peptidoglycan-associated protein